jgi:ABC-type lipoprotein release transport system permease subunit
MPWLRRLVNTIRLSRLQRDIDREIAFHGVTRFDPTTLLSVGLVVLTVATLASLVPASRAAVMSPMRALREE